jgi:hypothetical protein
VNAANVVSLVIGLALLSGGLGYALVLRRRGGVPVRSRAWRGVVVAAGAGAGILAGGVIVPVITALD